MDCQKALIVKRVSWSQAAEESLSSAIQHASIEDLKRQDGAVLFEVLDGQKTVGYYLLRVDRLADGPEGVVVAASSNDGAVDLTVGLLPHIERQFVGCRSVRIHTARTGLAKKLAKKGYSAGEIVMRKTL